MVLSESMGGVGRTGENKETTALNYVLSELRLILTRLHSVTSQTTYTFVVTVVKTSNLSTDFSKMFIFHAVD